MIIAITTTRIYTSLPRESYRRQPRVIKLSLKGSGRATFYIVKILKTSVEISFASLNLVSYSRGFNKYMHYALHIIYRLFIILGLQLPRENNKIWNERWTSGSVNRPDVEAPDVFKNFLPNLGFDGN